MNPREQLVDAICALVERETRRVAHEALALLVDSMPKATVPRVWGSVPGAVREACRDWAKASAVRALVPSASATHVQGTLDRLRQAGRLERRGERGSYEYRYLTVIDRMMAETAE